MRNSASRRQTLFPKRSKGSSELYNIPTTSFQSPYRPPPALSSRTEASMYMLNSYRQCKKVTEPCICCVTNQACAGHVCDRAFIRVLAKRSCYSDKFTALSQVGETRINYHPRISDVIATRWNRNGMYVLSQKRHRKRTLLRCLSEYFAKFCYDTRRWRRYCAIHSLGSRPLLTFP